MFSTATVTAFLFAIFIVGLGVTIWIDRKKTYILPPSLNFGEGGDELSDETQLAEHEESTETGDMRVKVSASGPGTAKVWSQLGYEYEYDGDNEQTLVVETKFSYVFNLQSDNGQAKVKTAVEVFLNSSNVNIVSASLPDTDASIKSKNDSVGEKSKSLKVTLNPGEKFVAYVRLSAEIEGSEGCISSAEMSANVDEINYRGELRPM